MTQPSTRNLSAMLGRSELARICKALAVLEAIYHHSPLTEPLVRTFNADLTVSELGEDLLEIGYP